MGERQTTLKQELREEILHELTTSPGVSALWPTAPPFVPSVGTDDVVTENDTGGEMTGTGTGTEDVTRDSGGGESLGTVAVWGGGQTQELLLLLPVSNSGWLHLMERSPGKPTGLGSSCWRR